MKTKRECNAHGDTKSNLTETQRALHKVQRMRVKMKNHARVPKQNKTLATSRDLLSSMITNALEDPLPSMITNTTL
jgi:hypothetical protein